MPQCVPVRFEQFRQVCHSGPPASRIPRWHLWLNPRRRSIPDGRQKSDSSEARPDARKKQHYLEIAGEKAFGEENIWTKASAPTRTNQLSIGGAPAAEPNIRDAPKGILLGNWPGDLRLG